MGMSMTFCILYTDEYFRVRNFPVHYPAIWTSQTFATPDEATKWLESRGYNATRLNLRVGPKPAWFEMRENPHPLLEKIWNDLKLHNHHHIYYPQPDGKLVKYWDANVGRVISKKLGRILASADIPPKSVEGYVAWYTSGTKPLMHEDYVTTFHQDQNFYQVYETGPASCMQGLPYVRAYESGDWEIAYLTNDDNMVVARCLVVPERKIYCRVYPSEGDYFHGFDSEEQMEEVRARLANHLCEQGYKSVYADEDKLDGLRLLKEHGVPYLDHLDHLRNEHPYYVISKHPTGLRACETDGEPYSTDEDYDDFDQYDD